MAVVYVLNLDVVQVRALLRAAGVAPHTVLATLPMCWLCVPAAGVMQSTFSLLKSVL